MDRSRLVRVTLQLYLRSLKEAWGKVLWSWWLAFLPLLYGFLLSFVALFVAPLGLVGGFVLGFALAACVSSYLYFMGEVVSGRRVSWQDVGESFKAYWGPVISVLFFLMLTQWTLALALPPLPPARALRTLMNLVLLVILNPVPEIIYHTRLAGFGVLGESLGFLRENWPEWFAPFLALAAVFFFWLPLPALLAPLMMGRLFSLLSWSALPVLSGSPFAWVLSLLGFFLFFLFMVFRGVLFRELHGSTRRQRLFRARFE